MMKIYQDICFTIKTAHKQDLLYYELNIMHTHPRIHTHVHTYISID